LQPLRGQPDGATPWIEGNDIGATIGELQNLPNRPGNLPYRFRDGLVMYLSAFAAMRSRDGAGRRLTPVDQQKIAVFLDRVCPPANAPANPNVDVNWTVLNQGLPINLSGHFNTIANIPEIATEPGVMLMLKHWLALMTAQAGTNIQQQARPWFGL
jgi:hypothetical protein